MNEIVNFFEVVAPYISTQSVLRSYLHELGLRGVNCEADFAAFCNNGVYHYLHLIYVTRQLAYIIHVV